MFSGIVEEKGCVKKMVWQKNLMTMTLEAKKVLRGSKIGDSIAVDGVCLTVTGLDKRTFTVDLMKETLDKTTLGLRKTKDKINLERALKVNSRLGGHFVQGHVDGVGLIKAKITKKNYVEYRIAIEKKLIPYLVPKGSVCVDGISLTVGEMRGSTFSVYIIPHTLKVTTLGSKKKGNKVNIETDLLAKHVVQLMRRE